MSQTIRLISSMATRQLLAELVAQFEQQSPHRVEVVSVGGVDAAKRVQAGEAFDVVVLAANAIGQLVDGGHAVAGTETGVADSGVAIAVRAGAPHPDVGSEDAVRRAVQAAPSLSYSTGPSGVHLVKLFERWGIAEAVLPRTVQAPPGVPVGSLVADGRVALGFQQLSELMHLDGIDVLGPLPDAIQTITTFTAAQTSASTQPEAVRALLAFLASPATAEAKRRHGMAPA